MKSDENKKVTEAEENIRVQTNHTTEPPDNSLYEESVQEILDYIEEQGIYIRE